MPFQGPDPALLNFLAARREQRQQEARLRASDALTASKTLADEQRKAELHAIDRRQKMAAARVAEVDALARIAENQQAAEVGASQARADVLANIDPNVADAATGTSEFSRVVLGLDPGFQRREVENIRSSIEQAQAPFLDPVKAQISQFGLQRAQQFGLSPERGRELVRGELMNERNRALIERERVAEREDAKAELQAELTTDAPLTRLEKLEAARDGAVREVMAASTDAQRRKAIDRLNLRQARLLKEVGGEQAFTKGEDTRSFVFKAMRERTDLESMAATVNDFIGLIEQFPSGVGLVGMAQRWGARVGELVSAVSASTETIAEFKLRFPDMEDVQSLPETEFELQMMQDLDAFATILALKITSALKPDRFNLGIYNEIRGLINLTGVRGPREAQRSLRSALGYIDNARKNLDSNIKAVSTSQAFSPIDRMAIDAGQDTLNDPGFRGEAVPFPSIVGVRDSRATTVGELDRLLSAPADDPDAILDALMGGEDEQSP